MRKLLSIFVGALMAMTITNAHTQYALTVEEYATDIVPGITTYRIYADLANADDFLSSVYGNENFPLEIASSTSFYNDQFGSSVASGINPAFISFFPTMAADSWVTIGIEGQNVGDEVAISTVESNAQPWVATMAFGSAIDGNDIVMNDATGGAWFVLNGTPNGLPDGDGRVLMAQLSSDGVLSGTINVQIFEHGVGSSTIYQSIDFNGVGTFTPGGDPSSIPGCTDSSACNYDPDATEDDGSCAVEDECGVCGGDGIAAGACDCDGNVEDALGVCGGTCTSDSDGNGVCDDSEIWGCMDSASCNYDETATQDDGSCESLDECGVCGGDGIAEGACDCEGNVPDTGYDCDGNCI
ncbi:MAG: hypothetical protein O3B11_05135, partial [Bacteroidetes bacterium]|nr:hypothetical protein [Bacteroidota bacterium]